MFLYAMKVYFNLLTPVTLQKTSGAGTKFLTTCPTCPKRCQEVMRACTTGQLYVVKHMDPVPLHPS